MRRILMIAITIALAICLLSTAFPALADGTALNVHTSTAADGTITAEIVLDGTLTVSGIQFALDYDAGRLQLTNHEDGDLKSGVVNDTEPGKIALVWYSVNGVPVSGESSVLKLTFAPKADGEANIAFNSGTLSTMVVDSNLNTIDTQTRGTTISVNGTGNITSSTSAPEIITNPVNPTPNYTQAVTPAIKTATIPPEERTAVTPSPSPADAHSAVPSIEPLESPEQKKDLPEPPVTPSPLIVENYDPPQLANTADPASVPLGKAEIEVVETLNKNDSYLWLWIAGGIALIGAGYLVYLRINKK